MDNIKTETRKEDAEKLLKDIEESGDLNVVAEMIKHNVIEFKINNQEYRVRLLELPDHEILNDLKTKKLMSLLQEKDNQGHFVYLKEQDLIALYKERGIDVNKVIEEIKKIDIQLNEKQLAAGKAVAHNQSEAVIKEYDTQIKNLLKERGILILQKTDYLEFSLENQLLNYVAGVVTYLTTEKKLENGTWERVWKDYDEFKNSKEKDLVNKAGTASIILQYSI